MVKFEKIANEQLGPALLGRILAMEMGEANPCDGETNAGGKKNFSPAMLKAHHPGLPGLYFHWIFVVVRIVVWDT